MAGREPWKGATTGGPGLQRSPMCPHHRALWWGHIGERCRPGPPVVAPFHGSLPATQRDLATAQPLCAHRPPPGQESVSTLAEAGPGTAIADWPRPPVLCGVAQAVRNDPPSVAFCDRPRLRATTCVLWQICVFASCPMLSVTRPTLSQVLCYCLCCAEGLGHVSDHFAALCGFHAILCVPWQAEITVL